MVVLDSCCGLSDLGMLSLQEDYGHATRSQGRQESRENISGGVLGVGDTCLSETDTQRGGLGGEWLDCALYDVVVTNGRGSCTLTICRERCPDTIS